MKIGKRAICAVCGIPVFKAGLCESHWLERQELFEIRPFKIQICDRCNRWFDGKWHEAGNVEEALKDAAESRIKAFGDIESVKIEIRKVQKGFHIVIAACGKIEGKEKKETRELIVPIRTLKCDNCIKLSGKYHEAVLQIRGPHAWEIIEIVDGITKARPKRIERLKYGWDVYFVHKADARFAVAGLKEFEVIRSHKLVGNKDGRDLYRDFYAVR